MITPLEQRLWRLGATTMPEGYYLKHNLNGGQLFKLNGGLPADQSVKRQYVQPIQQGNRAQRRAGASVKRRYGK